MPNTTVGAIIYSKDNDNIEILLTKRNIEPFKGYWCLPGGHVDKYEKVEEAIIREVKEETNMDFEPHFLCYMDEIIPGKHIHNVVLMFYGRASNTPEADKAEVSDIGWYSLSEALKLPLAFNHNEALLFFNKQILSKI